MNAIRTWRKAGRLLLFLGLSAPLMAQGPQDEKALFEFAQRLFKDASYADSAQEFKRFIAHFPTSDRLPEAMQRLGEAYFRSGNYQTAISACQAFIDKYPNRFNVAAVMRQKAKALQQLGEYTKAGTAFQEVHDAFPGGEYAPQDLLYAGKNFRRGGDLNAAEAAFRTLVNKYPKSHLVHEATYHLGLALLEANRPEEALVQFRLLAEYSGATERKPDALLEIGKVALVREDLQKAEQVFSQLRKGFPKSASAETSYLVMARWFAGRGDLQRAAQTYALAHGALPKNERRQQAVLGLAHAYRKLGRSADALNLYSQFLKTYPTSPFLVQARLGLGRAFADLKDDRPALEAFKRLLEEFPDADLSILAYSDMGDIWRKRGTPRKALNAYQTFLDRVEDSGEKASALLRIARLYEEDLGWYDRASDSYRKLLEAPPPYNSQGQFGLARTFEKTGQPNLAIREYRAYLQKYSDGVQAPQAETRIQYLREFAPTGNAPRADDFIALLADLPSVAADPEARFRLGRFLYQHRDYRRAAESFEAVLAADSSLSHAPEAGYLLGENYLKLARKTRLENRPEEAKSWQQKGLTAHQNVLSQYPQSNWADDAAVALIEGEVKEVAPDSARAVRMLEAYGKFEKTYPTSNRRDFALLRTADAYLLLGRAEPARISDALKAYHNLQKRFPQSALKEQAAYGIGICQARRKNYIDAEETLRDFLFEFSQSDLADQAQFELGRVLLEREYYASAAEEFSELLTAPSSLKLERSSRALLAECYFRLRDYQRAIRIDIGLLQRGADPALLRRLGRAYQESGQHEKAVRTYATFLRTFPDAADADSIAFTRAELLSFLNRTSEAIAAFQEFTKTFPKSHLRDSANRTVGDLLFQTNNYEKALRVYRNIPPSARNKTVAGREVLSLFRLKRIKEANKEVKKFKKAYRNARSWLALFEVEEGNYYLRAGNHKKALKTFNDVIKKYADTDALAEANYYRVHALYKAGLAEDYYNALVAFVKEHTNNRHWSEATLELADLYYKDEEYASASKAYQNALSNGLSPEKRPSILSKLVTVHRNLKWYDTAIQYARQLVQEFPRHSLAADARIDIGNMLHDKGDYQQAIEELSPLLKTVEKDDWSSVQNTIAESYFNMGEYDSAKRAYLNLRYNFQGTTHWLASAHGGLARCYEAQGSYRQAIEELKEIQRRFGSTSTFGLGAETLIQKLQKRLDTGRQ